MNKTNLHDFVEHIHDAFIEHFQDFEEVIKSIPDIISGRQADGLFGDVFDANVGSGEEI
jgi:hypothetical protein